MLASTRRPIAIARASGRARPERLHWSRRWSGVCKWDPPWVKWFLGGRLNAAHNCLDRHVDTHPERVAYFWEGEPGDTRRLTDRELHDEVGRFANALRRLGVRRGDRVAIYLGMVPELPVAMLACARIGAVHSVVFGGFSADALRDRINDADAEIVITADGAWRRGKIVPLKASADEAVKVCPSIRAVVVVRRTGETVPMTPGRDLWYHDLVEGETSECSPEEMDAEDPLYILYTSGTTGKPKGILHTTGGYLLGVSTTHRLIFDIHPEEDIYWCAADIGWVTGHSYIVYGPLANGTTSILYEGAPDYPEQGSLVVDRREVPGHDPLHRAHGDRCLHEVGPWISGSTRPLLAEAPGDRGRADQSRGMDVVLEGHRWRTLPGGGHLVADRDRDDPDHSAACSHAPQARLGDP